MTVTFTENKRIDYEAWRFVWESTLGAGTIYYQYVDGVLDVVGPATERTFYLASGESIQFEVLDSALDSPQPGYPGRVQLGWVPGEELDVASYYLVEEWVVDEWLEHARVPGGEGLGSFVWESDSLDDVTTHLFRVTGVSDAGLSGAVDSYSVLMVRRPDSPDVDYVYDEGTGKITVDEA